MLIDRRIYSRVRGELKRILNGNYGHFRQKQ